MHAVKNATRKLINGLNKRFAKGIEPAFLLFLEFGLVKPIVALMAYLCDLFHMELMTNLSYE